MALLFIYIPHGICWYTSSNPLADVVALLANTLSVASSEKTSSVKGVV